MQRRQLLKAGVMGAGAVGLGAAGYRYFPPSPHVHLGTSQEIATELFRSLDNGMMDKLVVEYDHPLRQYHNRGVWTGGELVATAGFSRSQLSLVADLFHSGLSTEGRRIVPSQFYQRVAGVMVHNLLFCGDPAEDASQVLFTGPHLNLRIGGKNVEGVAFGGPQVYGDQHGDEAPGLPGNVYQHQLNRGAEIYKSLTVSQQQLALLPESPIQTQIEIQGIHGQFAGIPVEELSLDAKARVNTLVDQILAPYPNDDVTYAMQCLVANGGTDALFLSYYADSSYDNGIYQTFRLEGPGSAFYFRGYPHLHAFFNIAMDAENPLSVGEQVGVADRSIEGEGMRRLLESSMQSAAGSDFAYYNADSVVGRISSGPVRTGDLYNAESWQNDLVVVEVEGRDLNAEFVASHGDTKITPERIYTIATTDYIANDRLDRDVGPGTKTQNLGLVRDALISEVRANGFS